MQSVCVIRADLCCETQLGEWTGTDFIFGSDNLRKAAHAITLALYSRLCVILGLATSSLMSAFTLAHGAATALAAFVESG